MFITSSIYVNNRSLCNIDGKCVCVCVSHHQFMVVYLLNNSEMK